MPGQQTGSGGTYEGTPIPYYWNPVWNLLWFGPWLALLVVLCLKPNRQAGAWTVLAPFLVLQGLIVLAYWALVHFGAGASPNGGFLFALADAVSLLVSAMAILWALSFALQTMPRVAAFFMAVLITAVSAVVGSLCLTGMSPAAAIGIVFLCALGVGALLVGLVIAGFCCRKRYTAPRFASWLLLWLVAMLALPTLPLVMLSALFMFIAMQEAEAVVPILAGGTLTVLGLGVMLYVMVIPFVLLAFRTTCYRDRFYCVFRLQGMLPEPAVEDGETGVTPPTPPSFA